MSESGLILSIDQGTTSTRAIVFDRLGKARATAQRELQQSYPEPGWVEHDPEEIWQATLDVCREVLGTLGGDADHVVSIGITNQRETTVVWDRASGKAIHPAIVWQDRRTSEWCRANTNDKNTALVREKTGLLLDPYFSATKASWILDRVPGARGRAEKGELAFGTIDCFLLWRLTEGKSHATDATNAARSMLFNIHTQQWDEELLRLFNVPSGVLPDVLDSAAEFGTAAASHFGRPLPVRGIAGDQQAATVGQACFHPGMVKSTYGTGCFMVLNTGDAAIQSQNRLLTTIGYRLDGKVAYAMEGSIFVAGAAVQWVRDGLKMISDAGETEELAKSVASTNGVYMVPAFVGLGAPYWDPDARGAILGITRGTGVAEIVRAALEAVCYQTQDLMAAMSADVATAGAPPPRALRVDGGMVANDWAMQFLSDILDLTVERPVVQETTALGAAYLAGLQSGLYQGLDEISSLWARERAFDARMEQNQRENLYQGWLDAVGRVRSKAE